jgi:hypothetical protein
VKAEKPKSKHSKTIYMKKLNLLFSLLILVAFTFSAKAQVEFGIKAGANFSNISMDFKDSDWEMATKIKPAFHFGVTADVPFSDNFSFQPGLLYSSKGFSYDMEEFIETFFGDLPEEASIDGYARATYNYLEVPLNFAFKTNGLQIFAGPYVAMGLSGKQKYDLTVSYMGVSDSDTDEMKLKPVFGEVKEGDLGEDEDAFSALDYGINAGVGYRVGPVLIQAGYSLGLGNMNPAYEGGSDSDRDDYKITNRVITLSASYYFGN